MKLGTRITQFYLEEGHVYSLELGKRPRITPNIRKWILRKILKPTNYGGEYQEPREESWAEGK